MTLRSPQRNGHPQVKSTAEKMSDANGCSVCFSPSVAWHCWPTPSTGRLQRSWRIWPRHSCIVCKCFPQSASLGPLGFGGLILLSGAGGASIGSKDNRCKHAPCSGQETLCTGHYIFLGKASLLFGQTKGIYITSLKSLEVARSFSGLV